MSKRREYELSETDLAKRAGQSPGNAGPVNDRYHEIKAAGGNPKAFFDPKTGGYRVVDEFEVLLRNHTERQRLRS